MVLLGKAKLLLVGETLVAKVATNRGAIVFLEVDTVTIEDVDGGLRAAARVDAAKVAVVIASNDGDDVTGGVGATSC